MKRILSLIMICIVCSSTLAIFAPSVIADMVNIYLESRELDGSTQNLGTMEFEPDFTFPGFSLPNMIWRDIRPLPYQALFILPSSHIMDHWETIGGLTLSDPYSGPLTNVYVNDPGTLIAVYKNVPPPTYDVSIVAHCNTEGLDVSVAITKGGSPSGYSTPHTFTGLTGTWTFAVPNTDSSSHPFKQWNTGATTPSITVSSGGTYTAYYESPPPPTYDVSIVAHCNTEGLDVSVAITKGGSPSGYSTPHTFTGLTGTWTFAVPNTDSNSHPFKNWNTGATNPTITVSTAGTYMAYYENPPPDLEVIEVEPIQVVDGARALIKDKDTAIRVDIKSTFSSDVFPFIDVYYDFGNHYQEKGKNQAGILLKPGINRIYLPGGPIYCKVGGNWVKQDLGGTYIWDPPEGASFFFKWTTTGTDNAIKVKVASVPGDDNLDNNEKTTSGKVVEAGPLRVLVLPVYFPLIGQTSFNPPNVNNQREFVRDIFPVGDAFFDWQLASAVPNFGIPLITPPALSLEDWLYLNVVIPWEATATMMGYNRMAVVIKGFDTGWDGKAIGMGRLPEDRMSVIVRNEALPLADCLVAHELGHTYYLWHPNQDGGYGPNIIDAQIFHVWSLREYEDMESNLMRSPTDPSSWIDNQRYDSDPRQWIQYNPSIPFFGTYRWNLYEQLLNGPDPELLVVTGAIFTNGTVGGDLPWYRTDGVPSLDSTSTGNYSICLLDSGNQLIAQYGFNATFSYMTEVGGSMQEMSTDVIPFFLSVPYVDGTVFVQIRDSDGKALLTKGVSSNSPTVDIIFPNSGVILALGNYTVSWDGRDSDGDNLSYNVGYSADGVSTWVPLAVNLNQTSYEWDTSFLESGNNYLVKIIATDGVNTGEAVSGVFTVDLDLPPDFAVVNVEPSKTVASETYGLRISATAINQGYSTQPFNITVYANETLLTRTTDNTLEPGGHMNFTFVWNTTDFSKGNYTVRVCVDPLAGEIDIEDNNCTGAWVLITFSGDINGDFTVDIYDAIRLAGTYNSTPTSPSWNPNADINGDNTVDIYDAIILAGYFNQHYP